MIRINIIVLTVAAFVLCAAPAGVSKAYYDMNTSYGCGASWYSQPCNPYQNYQPYQQGYPYNNYNPGFQFSFQYASGPSQYVSVAPSYIPSYNSYYYTPVWYTYDPYPYYYTGYQYYTPNDYTYF